MTAIKNPLEFERELVALEQELTVLKDELAGGDQSRATEFAKLEKSGEKLQKETYGKLTSYQRVQLSRHFDHPFTLDYIRHIFTDFVELHGDRCYGDDSAIVGGTARFGEVGVVVVGHQRGRTTEERLHRNFGMANPEGYRKALRLFELAEKFEKPIFTFIDTQGAYPGMEAEERGQAEAIAKNLLVMSELTTPIISVVIGEGGSGGALALGVADRILMLENACYSVITPEGCASILWHKDNDRNEPPSEKASVAADALKLTAEELKKRKVIDEVVPEPRGGAHRNHREAAEILGSALRTHLEALADLSVEELVEKRYEKFRAMGHFTGDE